MIDPIDLITDELFEAKRIIEKELLLKGSLDENIIKNLKKASSSIEKAQALIEKYNVEGKIKTLDFLDDDIHYIMIYDFFNKLVNAYEPLYKLYIDLCKQQLDI